MQAIYTKIDTNTYRSLESVSLYLGYSLRFRNPISFFDLVGHRADIDIHNLSHSRSVITSVLNTLNQLFYSAGTVWIIYPIATTLIQFFDIFHLKQVHKTLVLWTEKWLPGLFTNRTAYQKIRWTHRYPTALFYPTYSMAEQSLSDGRKSSLLQIGLADSNSSRNSYSITIPGNEKSQSSNVFLINIAFQSFVKNSIWTKTRFIFQK